MEQFDAEYFGYSAREASLIDPQQRIFLELCLEALERGGHDPARFDGAIGVFGGSAQPSYLLNQLLPARDRLAGDDEPTIMIGNNRDHLTTRVAWALGLRGPAVNVQTSCSTSMTAVHLACQSLLGGECDMALAGGVSIDVPHGRATSTRRADPVAGRPLPRLRRRGRGTVPGNGAGVVLLRAWRTPLADGDPIAP